jgi:peroxiredoxin
MRTLEIGGKLEDHTFENLDGTDLRLSDMITDRTIICFFSVDCGSCFFELEEMQATLKGSLHNHVILISHDDRVSLQKARTAYNIESPILWDQNGFYARNLNIQVRPFNVMIDSTLTIRKIVAGKLNGSEFHEFISE